MHCRCICSQEGALGLSQAGVVQDVDKIREGVSRLTWAKQNHSADECLVNQLAEARAYKIHMQQRVICLQ